MQSAICAQCSVYVSTLSESIWIQLFFKKISIRIRRPYSPKLRSFLIDVYKRHTEYAYKSTWYSAQPHTTPTVPLPAAVLHRTNARTSAGEPSLFAGRRDHLLVTTTYSVHIQITVTPRTVAHPLRPPTSPPVHHPPARATRQCPARTENRRQRLTRAAVTART